MKINWKPLLLTLAGPMFAGAAFADSPVFEITAPTGTVFCAGFPCASAISFEVTHSELKSINVLKVEVNGSLIVDVSGNPFDNDNQCHSNLTQHTTSCSSNGSDFGSATFPWTIAGIGDYVITVSARHQSATGSDEETVAVVTLTAEYPAPPAVANRYINTSLPKLAAKKRGCVISQIAQLHAQQEEYGPKGGPYDEDKIKAHVDSFISGC